MTTTEVSNGPLAIEGNITIGLIDIRTDAIRYGLGIFSQSIAGIRVN